MREGIIDFLKNIDDNSYQILNINKREFYNKLNNDKDQEIILKYLFNKAIDLIDQKFPNNERVLLFYTFSLWNRDLKLNKILTFRKEKKSDIMLKIINDDKGQNVSLITELLYENILKKNIVIITNSDKFDQFQSKNKNTILVKYNGIKSSKIEKNRYRFLNQRNNVFLSSSDIKFLYDNYQKDVLLRYSIFGNLNKFENYLRDRLANFISLMKWSSSDSAHYIIIPYLGWMDDSIGALFLKFSEKIDHQFIEKLMILEVIVNKIYSEIGGIFMHLLALSRSIRTAIAAIMSRNGSHNIGSHILSSVSNNYNELPDDQILYKYIQDRMDYIAQITTEFPTWSYPVWFVRDVMRNFYMQQHLQNYIARSEGLSAFYYQDKSARQDKIIIKIKRTGKDFIIAPDSDNTSFEQDVSIAIPGGIVGQQAFYTILENIIRNNAKHNWAGQSQDAKKELQNLEITIEIDENSDRGFVIFRIWDNISNIFGDAPISEDDLKRLPTEGGTEKVVTDDFSNCSLHQAMNSKLSQSFIDQSTGQLLKANWGLAEMKISAGFLNKKDTSVIGSNEIKDTLFEYSDQGYTGIISAVPIWEKIEKAGTEKEAAYRYHLGYQFAIPKPKEVLICGQFPAIENKDEDRRHSIYFQEGDSEKNIDYEFVVLIDDGNNEFINQLKRYLKNSTEGKDELDANIKNDIERFPFRLFIVSDELHQQFQQAGKQSTSHAAIQFLTKRIVTLPENLFKQNAANNHQNFKLFLYAEWIRHLKHMRGLDDSQLRMLINLEGGNKHNNKQRIFRLIFDKFKDEMIDDLKMTAELDWEAKIKEQLRSITTHDLDGYDGERREHRFEAAYYNMDSLIDSWVQLSVKEFQTDPSTGRFGFDEGENDFKFNLKVSEELAYRVADAGEQLKEIAKKYYAIVKKVYVRYEEDTPTLPPIYRADGAGSAEIRLEREINEIVNLKIINNRYQEPFDIAYNRHEPAPAAIYSESLSGAQTYFSILNHLPNDAYLRQKIGLQLVENALLRLMVIDERVAQYYTNFQYAMKEKYLAAGIEIPLRVKPIEGDSESIDLVQNVGKAEPILDLENIAENRYDLMVIHQGILDKLYKNATKSQLSEFLKKVKERVPYIIITSGRGEPENIPDDAKFLAFSNIETFLLKDHPEKFLLSQIAMKITSIKRH